MRRTMVLMGLATMCAANAGCVAQSGKNADRFREGIPSEDEVRLEEPVAAGASTAAYEMAPGLQAQNDGDATVYATYYRFTREIFDGVNRGTAAILGSIWILVHHPPTTVEDDEATWGPWSEALSPAEWQFRATEVADNEYDYTLEARPKGSSDAWQPIWVGQGYGDDHLGHGRGWFEIDFDAANEVDPTRLRADDESGSVKVTYDLTTWPTTITAHQSGEDAATRFNVTLVTQQGGGGRVEISAHDDVDDAENTAKEDVTMKSRWLASGAGRADVTIANGDLEPGFSVEAAECWSETFERVYWTDNVGISADEGSEAMCAFSSTDR